MVKTTLFKEGSYQDRYRGHCNGILQGRERLGSTLKTACASGNIQPRSRVRVSRWQTTKRKLQG